jgi:3-oxoacyl-(acyl-carrier-protein) synthase
MAGLTETAAGIAEIGIGETGITETMATAETTIVASIDAK